MHCVTFHLPSFVLSLFASSPRLSLFIPLFFILLCRFVQSAFYCFLMSEFLFISLSLFLPPPPFPALYPSSSFSFSPFIIICSLFLSGFVSFRLSSSFSPPSSFLAHQLACLKKYISRATLPTPLCTKSS